MKQFFVISLLMLLEITGSSQNLDSSITNSYEFGAGYQNFRTLDLNTSPLLFVANNGIVLFQFEKMKSKIDWNLGASFALGGNQSERFGVRTGLVLDPYLIDGSRDSILYVINPAISFIKQSLKFSYNWHIKSTQPMSIGASIYSNFHYGGMGADSWFFYQLSLLPSYNLNILNKDEHNLTANVSISILSFIVRQPYARRPSLPESSSFKAHLKTGSALAFANSFQQLNFKLKYIYRLRNGNNLGLSYYFTWMRYTNIPDRNLGAYSNSILISYTLCKKK